MLLRLSPSLITSMMFCKLSFYYKYAKGIKPPPNSDSDRGTLIHKVFEKTLKGDEDIETDKEELALYSPKIYPKIQDLIKERFADKVFYSEYVFKGNFVFEDRTFNMRIQIDLYIDCFDTIEIYDIKTKKNSRYIPQADALKDNVQLNLYAVVMGSLLPDDTIVKLGQIFITTEGKIHVIETTKTTAEIKQFFKDTIIPNYDESIGIVNKEEKDIQGNISSCIHGNSSCYFLETETCRMYRD